MEPNIKYIIINGHDITLGYVWETDTGLFTVLVEKMVAIEQGIWVCDRTGKKVGQVDLVKIIAESIPKE